VYSDPDCAVREGRCGEHEFRLAVYEAGHALTARALGLNILSVRMLPRPPVLVSDKTFTNNDWNSFIETLEIRIIELFGGQIAEELACNCNTCGSGDIARIDELARLIAGLGEALDHETVLFDLEDVAQGIFADEKVRDAVLPIAEFFHARMMNKREEIPGSDIEAELDRYIPRKPKEKWLKRLFG